MPRERIYGSEMPFGDDDVRRTVVDVCWSREAEYVQLATILIDGVTGEPVDVNRVRGEAELRVAGGSDEEMVLPAIHGGMYLQLNRHGCNELIRKLRRARDQAFGRDE